MFACAHRLLGMPKPHAPHMSCLRTHNICQMHMHRILSDIAHCPGRLSQPLIPFHLSPSLTCGSPPFAHTLASIDMCMGKTQHTVHQFMHIRTLHTHSVPHSCALTQSVLSGAILPSCSKSQSHASTHHPDCASHTHSPLSCLLCHALHILRLRLHLTPCIKSAVLHKLTQSYVSRTTSLFAHISNHASLSQSTHLPFLHHPVHTPSISTPFLYPLALYLA